MSLFDWFANRRKSVPNSQERPEREIADGLWNKCEACGALSYTKDLRANQMVCLECGHHIRVYSDDRIEQLIDPNTWMPINEGLHATDPLKFRDRKKYSDRLREFQEKTGHLDAVETGIGKLENLPVALGVMEFQFIGGSMGSVVGEKLTRLIEHATRERLPAIVVCASGGARMQEGMLSLMQMAKISGALERHREARLLYIPILTHPTTGGVTASFAMLGDIIIAEPKATVACYRRPGNRANSAGKAAGKLSNIRILLRPRFCRLDRTPDSIKENSRSAHQPPPAPAVLGRLGILRPR